MKSIKVPLDFQIEAGKTKEMSHLPNFIKDEDFQHIKELIDFKCNRLFNKLISLSPNKEELKELKESSLEIFYEIISRRIVNNPELTDEKFRFSNAKRGVSELKTLVLKEKDGNNLWEALQGSKDSFLSLQKTYKDDDLLDTIFRKYSNTYMKYCQDHNIAYSRFLEIIDEVFLMPNLVLSAFEPSLENYKNKLESLKPKIKRADKMTGKKLTQKKKKEYIEILNKQKDLTKIYGRNSQVSSLTNAIRSIKKYLPKNKIKSIAGSIKYHQGKGNLPK